MAIRDFFKDKKYEKESLPFEEVKKQILEKYDVDHIDVDYNSFPDQFQIEIENVYINKIVQTKRGYLLQKKQSKRTEAQITRHYIFSGNPGTGKSTAARLMGFFFENFEILKPEKFKEVSRADLVGDVVGMTEKKIKEVLEDARGGILFINEAHQLFSDDSKDFGKIAIQEIMKYMEDHREEIVIIIDGIPDKINLFLNLHPGLRDRFSRKIHFHDLTDESLCRISDNFLAEYQYHFEDSARNEFKKLISIVREHYKNQKSEFANFRTVRNVIDLILDEHNKRLFKLAQITTQDFTIILKEDVEKVIQFYNKAE